MEQDFTQQTFICLVQNLIFWFSKLSPAPPPPPRPARFLCQKFSLNIIINLNVYIYCIIYSFSTFH